MTKKIFMQFVLAIITLATTQTTDHAALETAQKQAKDAADQLQALKDADAKAATDNALTDEEQGQVQQALNLISAATPPAPEAIAAVEANVAGADQGPSTTS
jgi:hypothetical protein